MLEKVKQAEDEAERILESGRRKSEDILRRAEVTRLDKTREVARKTGDEISRIQKDTEIKIARLKGEGKAEGRRRGEALKEKAEERMPAMVDELVSRFKAKLSLGPVQ
jgi:hypothetical protein